MARKAAKAKAERSSIGTLYMPGRIVLCTSSTRIKPLAMPAQNFRNLFRVDLLANDPGLQTWRTSNNILHVFASFVLCAFRPSWHTARVAYTNQWAGRCRKPEGFLHNWRLCCSFQSVLGAPSAVTNKALERHRAAEAWSRIAIQNKAVIGNRESLYSRHSGILFITLSDILFPQIHGQV